MGHTPLLLFLLMVRTAQAEPMIVNGTDTNAFPAVVKIEQKDGTICSGTIVGENTVLSVAHCMYDLSGNKTSITVELPDGTKREPIEIITPDPYDFLSEWKLPEETRKIENDLSLNDDEKKDRISNVVEEILRVSKYGLALLIFSDEERLPHPARIRVLNEEEILLEKEITLVGFGANDHRWNMMLGLGVKRMGTNKLDAAFNGLYFWVGYRGKQFQHPDGSDVGVGGGDSGGAVLIDGDLIATMDFHQSKSMTAESFCKFLETAGEKICEIIDYDELKSINFGISLSDPESVVFLQSAQVRGAKINISYGF